MPDEETLAAKVVVKRQGPHLRAEFWLAQDETGNPKLVGHADAVVIENAVPLALQTAAAELFASGGRGFFKTEITEGDVK